MNIAEKVTCLIKDAVESCGCDLYDVTYRKESDGMNLNITIDKSTDQITVEDCERVSHAVDPILDEADIIPTGYNLNVQSIGLDATIKDDRDFRRNLGKPVEITLYAKQNGRKDFTGILTAWDEGTVTIEDDRVFMRKDIAHIVPHIEF